MSGRDSPVPDLVAVGANHRSAPLPLRERLFVEPLALAEALADLRAAGIGEAILISTCDRIEVHAVHRDAEWAAGAIRDVLARRAGLDAAAVKEGFYALSGAAALRQLFAVAASLDSHVIGEPQVLGQLKESHRVARAAGMVGSELEGLLQTAYRVAKRVRSETSIGEGAVSIAAAAVEVAREIHGDLGARTGLLVGLGDMGELVARHLRQAGLGRLAVLHRSTARAGVLAHQLGANVLPADALDEAVADADIVVSVLGLGSYTVTRARARAALRARRYRPLFVVDLAVPPDVEPGVGDIDGAFVYDMADLEGVTRAGLADREKAADAAWKVIDDELDRYLRARSMRRAAPAVVALRRRFEAERARLLAEVDGRDAAHATRLLINRLLHAPSEALRELAAEENEAGRAAAEALLRRLFRLDIEDEAGGTDDTRDEKGQP